MLRLAHRWPGLLAAIVLIVLSLSGVALSVFPASESLMSPQAQADLTVGRLAERVHAVYPDLSQIRRAPSGKITAYWFDNGTPKAAVIDPATGKGVGSADGSPVERWLVNLHRSLFLGDNGRIVTAIAAGLMLVLSISGILLVARRTGGWLRFFTRLKGPLAGRIHVEMARVTVLGLMFSSLTALWMTASTFGFLPQGPEGPDFPASVSGQSNVSLTAVPAFQSTPVSSLRSLTFPAVGDATDVYTLQTDAGTGYVDQGNGAMLAWADAGIWDRISQTIMMLHTGRGFAVVGLFLGAMALGIPAMALTGIQQWLAARRSRPRIKGNAHAAQAETIILVGSEGGSTWGFAGTLHAALTAENQKVHVAPMSGFNPGRYGHARQFVIMAATYGDGDAPASAKGFLDLLAALPEAPKAPVAVLGFGDRSFPHFSAYGGQVAQAAAAKGWKAIIGYVVIDRQSPQDFARWGKAFGKATGIALELDHKPVMPRISELQLVSRRDYGTDLQANAAILRFKLPVLSFWQRLTGHTVRYEAGDLVGIIPEGSPVARFYSLASSRRDGFVEICVRKHPAGLCSSQLVELQPGATVRAFFRSNPGFRPARGRKPVILIGAGTGIGPLAGFARANTRQRPMHLYFGARHPTSDAFYAPEIALWQSEGRLSSATTAFSRAAEGSYVQDALRRDGKRVAGLIAAGAQVMVCGGADMAAGVAEALADIMKPLGLTPAKLKAEGRYAEDVY
jgi:sulfite reductase (NADPH) flavoprotein alpha-component